jgi:hypothetical protein
MKQAKKRLLPTLAKLQSSTKRADRAMTQTLAAVAASNKRILRMEQRHANTLESLKTMLAAFAAERHGGEVMAWPYVGREVPAEVAADNSTAD